MGRRVPAIIVVALLSGAGCATEHKSPAAPSAAWSASLEQRMALAGSGWSSGSETSWLAIVRAANLDDPTYAAILRDGGRDGAAMLAGALGQTTSRGHEQMQRELERAIERAYGVSRPGTEHGRPKPTDKEGEGKRT